MCGIRLLNQMKSYSESSKKILIETEYLKKQNKKTYKL